MRPEPPTSIRMPVVVSFVTAGTILCFTAACSGSMRLENQDSGLPHQEGGADGRNGAPAIFDGGASGPGPTVDGLDGGPTTCGDQVCGASQACIHQVGSCGGAAPTCFAPDDAGQCPVGWDAGWCDVLPPDDGGPRTGCWAPPCKLPPPNCADIPASCGGQLSCGCMPATTCVDSMCGYTTGHDVQCANG